MEDRERADLAKRYRAYMEDSQPIIRALTELLAVYPSPRFIVRTGETATSTQFVEAEYPADVQMAIDATRAQLAMLRRSYGL